MAAKPTSWDVQRAKAIVDEAKQRYGAGWALLSEDQRSNHLAAAVLGNLMAQADPSFAPAQDMVARLQHGIDEALRAKDEPPRARRPGP